MSAAARGRPALRPSARPGRTYFILDLGRYADEREFVRGAEAFHDAGSRARGRAPARQVSAPAAPTKSRLTCRAAVPRSPSALSPKKLAVHPIVVMTDAGPRRGRSCPAWPRTWARFPDALDLAPPASSVHSTCMSRAFVLLVLRHVLARHDPVCRRHCAHSCAARLPRRFRSLIHPRSSASNSIPSIDSTSRRAFLPFRVGRIESNRAYHAIVNLADSRPSTTHPSLASKLSSGWKPCALLPERSRTNPCWKYSTHRAAKRPMESLRIARGSIACPLPKLRRVGQAPRATPTA